VKVLLVNGSPHSKGCTYTGLLEIQKTLKEEHVDSEIFQIGNKPISGCIACGACSKLKKCAINGTVNEFLKVERRQMDLYLDRLYITLVQLEQSHRLWTEHSLQHYVQTVMSFI